MKKTTLAWFLLIPQILMSQGSSVGASLLKIPNSARIAAMGEAQVADPGSFSSSFLNPANVAMSTRPEIVLAHTEWIQDVQNDFLATSLPFLSGKVGLAIANTNIRGIEVREVPGAAVATFTARSAAFQVLYALQVSDELSLGTNVKYLYEKIFVDESSGYGIDLGGLYKLSNDGLFIGVSVTNLGSMGKFRAAGSDLPSQLQLGLSYLIPEPDLDIVVAASFVRELIAKQSRMNFGSEIRYDNTFSIRIGYQTGFESRSVTTGLGCRYAFATIDYAYIPFSLGLGNVHIISLGFDF